MPIITPVPMYALAIVRIGTTSSKIFDYHVFPATALGKQQIEAKIAKTNSFRRRAFLFLTGRRYALYCADARDIVLRIGNIHAFPIPISLPNDDGLVAFPYLSDIFLRGSGLSAMSRVESQSNLVDLCGGLVPVLDTEPLVLLKGLVRWALLLTVFVVSTVLWVTIKAINMEHGLAIMAVGLAICHGIKWLLHG